MMDWAIMFLLAPASCLWLHRCEYRNRYCMDQLVIFEAWRHFLCIPLFQSMLQRILFLCSTNANPKSADKHPVYDYYVTGQCVTVLRLLHYVCVHTEHIFMTDWTIWTHLRHTLNRWIGYNYMISTLTNDLISINIILRHVKIAKHVMMPPNGLQHVLGTHPKIRRVGTRCSHTFAFSPWPIVCQLYNYIN